MKTTTRFNLKKPDPDDFVNIEDLNQNMDVIDENLGKAPRYHNYVMRASSWSGTSYDLSGYTGDLEVYLSDSANLEQYRSFANARLVGSTSSNKIKAYGQVPEIDIPIIIREVE